MGYFTRFNLELVNASNPLEIIKDFRDNNINAYDALRPDGSYYNEEKWYEADAEIVEFSKKYPEVVFKLFGIGDSHDDLWCLIVRNGKYYYEDMIKRRIIVNYNKLK